MRGMLLNSLSMLRDFKFGEQGQDQAQEQAAGAGAGAEDVPLTVAGGLGATLGEPGVREQVAEALLEVWRCAGGAGVRGLCTYRPGTGGPENRGHTTTTTTTTTRTGGHVTLPLRLQAHAPDHGIHELHFGASSRSHRAPVVRSLPHAPCPQTH